MHETDWTAATATAHRVLAEHDGLTHISRFLAAGLTRHQVAALYRRDALKRPRIGWYAHPSVPHDGIRAARIGGALGCVSAAAAWGLPVPEHSDAVLHVVVPDDATRLRHSRDRTWRVAAGDEEGVRLHWQKRQEAVRGWRASVVDTLLQLALCVPFDWLVAAMDAALHVPRGGSPLLSPSSWALVRAELPERLRPACDLADGRAESPIETLLRLALLRAGIDCEIQVWIVPWYRVDILIDGWLVIEADGWAKMSGKDQYDLDRVRDAQLARWGYRTLRFTYRQITQQMRWVVDVITEVRAQRL